MRKNLSAVNLAGPGLTIRTLNSPQNKQQKVQGFDKSSTCQSFVAKVQKIKNKPKNETLEQQYVKGLQDQIHYLQMQLKLLKQKEIAKHSQVDQLETFFGDGIPINENILSMKNGFNNYKSQMDKKIAALQSQKLEREGLISSFRAKIEELSKQIVESQKQYKKQLTQKSDITHQKSKSETYTKQQIQYQQQALKSLKTQNRRISQFLQGLQRTKQLLLVTVLKADANKYTKLNKLKQTIKQKEIEFSKLGKKYFQLKKQDEDNCYVINLEQSNLKLKKKIISLEKQLSALNIKVYDKKLDLEGKLKDRLKEINARLDMQARLDKIKEDIQYENNMTIQELEKIAREGEAKILQAILDKNKKLTKYSDFYGSLLYKVQQKLYEYGQKKPDLKRQLQLYQNQIKILQKQLQNQKQRHCVLSSEISKQRSKTEHIVQIVPPMLENVKRDEQKIKVCKAERQQLIKEIKFKQKQLQLMEILKCLSLEEVQITNSSNSSIQDRLLDFMRSWETINRNV